MRGEGKAMNLNRVKATGMYWIEHNGKTWGYWIDRWDALAWWEKYYNKAYKPEPK